MHNGLRSEDLVVLKAVGAGDCANTADPTLLRLAGLGLVSNGARPRLTRQGAAALADCDVLQPVR